MHRPVSGSELFERRLPVLVVVFGVVGSVGGLGSVGGVWGLEDLGRGLVTNGWARSVVFAVMRRRRGVGCTIMLVLA